MKKKTSKIQKTELTLEKLKRTHVLEQTDLANERTLLSFVQTSLAMIVAGTSFVQFLKSSEIIQFVGWFFIICGIEVLGVGAVLYSRVKNTITKDKESSENMLNFELDEPQD